MSSESPTKPTQSRRSFREDSSSAPQSPERLRQSPHIILADEPTGSLDSRTGMGVMLTLASLNERCAQTIVVVTHNEELAQTASRRIRIEDGRVVSDSKAGTYTGFTSSSSSAPAPSPTHDPNKGGGCI